VNPASNKGSLHMSPSDISQFFLDKQWPDHPEEAPRLVWRKLSAYLSPQEQATLWFSVPAQIWSDIYRQLYHRHRSRLSQSRQNAPSLQKEA
jgi:hypothetical protein